MNVPIQLTNLRGVTLLEVLTVLVVVALLATFAVPAYRGYLLRAQRTDAAVTLLRVHAAQEKFFLENSIYAEDFGPAGLGLRDAAAVSLASDQGRYTIQLTTHGATSFTVQATASAQQTQDKSCLTLTIDEQGRRGSAPGPVAECWK
jgi:type IV pilus assembly protein PilE